MDLFVKKKLEYWNIEKIGIRGVIVQGMVGPAGILLKIHNENRWEIMGNVFHCRNQAFKGCSSRAEWCKR